MTEETVVRPLGRFSWSEVHEGEELLCKELRRRYQQVVNKEGQAGSTEILIWPQNQYVGQSVHILHSALARISRSKESGWMLAIVLREIENLVKAKG